MTAIKKLEEQFIQLVGQVSNKEKSKNIRLYNQTKKISQLLKEANEHIQLEFNFDYESEEK